jgi:flagellar motor protein MotB
MMASLAMGLGLLIAAANANVVVVTLTKGSVTIPLDPSGKAELKRDGTVTRVKIELEHLVPPLVAGPAYNTYVAWSVSPEGSYENIGELELNKDKGRLEATTRFGQVGILVTAEPHYMVDRPSAAVVSRSLNPRGNDIRRMNVSLEVGTYDYSAVTTSTVATLPILVLEARAALQVAKTNQADRWAETEYRRAVVASDTMEEMVSRASPFDIVAQSANEVIRRAQQSVTAARDKKAGVALENAQVEITTLKQEAETLNAQIRQLTDQRNTATAQVQRLTADLAAANRDRQQVTQERDQAIARERTASRDLADLKKKEQDLQSLLVLPLRAEFFDVEGATLSPAGRDALTHLIGIAGVISGTVRLEGPAPDALFDAARQFLIEGGIVQDRIVLKR